MDDFKRSFASASITEGGLLDPASFQWSLDYLRAATIAASE
jgi:hypothetical protein